MSEEMSDDELQRLIGEAACASRPAPDKETLAEYLERIAREDDAGERDE